ncbi:MAG: hypothetical protein MI892_14555 [Desulfobacterales bacterium]|nr:hypothetical protein [Desulfobacterales bacterium]
MRTPAPAIINLVVFITSFSILAYEINYMRVYAYTQWHNLSALIITMALLGFGSSGAILSVIQKKVERHFSRFFYGSALLFPMAISVGFTFSSQLDFNPYEISFNLNQIFHLFLYFSIMGIVFFIGAGMICMALLRYKISFAYFSNLLGSAAGVIFVLLAAFFFHPSHIMMIIIMISLIPACLLAHKESNPMKAGTVFVLLLTIGITVSSLKFFDFKKVSQYKSISGALALPESKILHEAYSPLGVLQVVEAKGLRSTAGLSLVSPFQVPVQKLFFLNGEGASPVTPFNGESDEIRYLQYLTSYLPFDLINPENAHALIVGAGGGTSLLKAKLAGIDHIDALEVNQNLIDIMKKNLDRFSGNIYTEPKTTIINNEARNFIRRTTNKYDLIDLSMIDGFNTTASGVHGLNETYLYTVESIKDLFSKLTDNGMLALTRWVVTPARGNLKLFNMVITALKQMDIESPGHHLIAIRSLQTLTLVVFKNSVSESQVAKTLAFAESRRFDMVYYPGITEKEANTYIRLETPVYYHGMKMLLGPNAQSYIDNYLFDIRSATDNRPYFYNDFKPAVLKLIRTFGLSQIPVTEWGYLLLLVILFPVLAISSIFIFGPLLFFENPFPKKNTIVLLYFSCIGAGFFFIEMPLIQKMILFLGQPVYALSVVIALILFFSGIGSYFSDRLFTPEKRILICTVIIASISIIYMLVLDEILLEFIHLDLGPRFMFVALLIAPLGFFMGIPFPAGLDLVKKSMDASIPWAWGINGFFSVISILCAVIIAVIMGFKLVLTIAALLYFGAGVLSLKLSNNS